MKKLITLLLIVALCFQQLLAAPAIFTIIKIEPNKEIHLKGDNNKYYALAPLPPGSRENFQEYISYPGEIISATALKLTDSIGNVYTFSYINEPPPPDDSATMWWLFFGSMVVFMLVVSSAMNR